MNRNLIPLVLVAIGVVFAVGAGPAPASKQVVDYFGTESGFGAAGGEFIHPNGIAVNQTSAGPAERGDIYVVDGAFPEDTHRIQRFGRDENGTPANPGDDTYYFVSAWGAGVLTGGTAYEICTEAALCGPGVASGGNGTDSGNGALGRGAIGLRPTAIAIDQDTGNVYVSDAANFRVNVYEGDGTFLRSFGYDVVESGPGQIIGPDEEQQLTVKASAGKFSLSFRGSSTGLEARGWRQSGTTTITQAVAFEGAFAPGQAISGKGIAPGTTITKVSAGTLGEILTISQPATASTVTNEPFVVDDLPFDASASEVQAALNSLPSIGGAGGSVTVSGGPGDATGSSPYLIHFGGSIGDEDVPTLTPTIGGLTTSFSVPAEVTIPTVGGAFEVCSAAAGDICKSGNSSDQIGGIAENKGNRHSALSIAISAPDGDPATGSVFLADTGNRRVNVYSINGTSPSSFGSAAEFGSTEKMPNAVAVDSRGIVYVSSDRNQGEIARYDTQNANGAGIGFLAPIPAAVNEEQQVKIAATAGQFRLSFEGETTPDISFNASSEAVKAALEALPAIGTGNVTVAGGSGDGLGTKPYIVTFTGAFAAQDVEQLVAANGTAPLSGGSGAVVTTLTTVIAGPFPGTYGNDSSPSTTALMVDLDSDEGGPDSDALYVSRRSGIWQLGPLNAPGLTTPPLEADDVHALDPPIRGNYTALDELDERIYVTSDGQGTGVENHGVYLLDDPTGPASASLDSIDGITATSATVHATINPNGPPTTRYRLEYSLDGSKWVSTPTVTLGTQEAPQPVDIVFSLAGGGLEPNTLYQVRLVVAKPFKPLIVTPPLTFTTLGAPPLAETVGAPVRTATTAQLGGRITPRNSPTTFTFEYGSEGPCDSNPCQATSSQSAGSGAFTRLVSAEIEGLEPGTTYHYRVVADNGNPGTPVAGQDMTVTTRASDAPLSHGHFPGPPGSDRAWEQVSAPDSGGNPVLFGALISDDGNRAVYGVTGGTPSSETGAFNQFFAERTQSGWQTRDNYPKRSQTPSPSWSMPVGRSDLARFFTLNWGFGSPAAFFEISPDGSPDKLYETPIANLFFFSASDDGSRVVAGLMGSHDPNFPVVPGVHLYDITSGDPRLISLLPGGIPPACGVGKTIEFDAFGAVRTIHWLSPDGDTLFFASQGSDCTGVNQIYLRNLVTEESELVSKAPVSGSDCGAHFIKSAPGAAFFWTKSRLAVEDAVPSNCSDFSKDGDVYRYLTVDDSLECVTCAVPGGAADIAIGTSNNQAAYNRIAVSEDGSRVYFLASTRLLPGAQVPGVYRVDVGAGDLAYVGQIDPFNADEVGVGNALNTDGSVLIFRADDSSLNAIGGSNNGGSAQFYRYDDKDRSLICLSCPLDGNVPRSGVTSFFPVAVGPNQTTLSADGSTFAFTTTTALVGSDQNTASPGQNADLGTDVYEWRDGRLLLVTDGLTNWAGSFSVPQINGITPSGRDIIFSAAAQYTPDALDDYQRMYVAKIGGGIEFPAAESPCPLEVCQGTPKGAPEEVPPGTGALSGPGNPHSIPVKGRCPKGKRKVRRSGKVRCVKRNKPRSHRAQQGSHTRRDAS